MSKKIAVCIFSGGMDSTTILYQALKDNDEVYVITFDYGQRHSKEIQYAEDTIMNLIQRPIKESGIIMDHRIVDLKFFGKLLTKSAITSKDVAVPEMADIIGEPQSSCYVPNRNMTMIAIVASYAENVGASSIYTGITALDNLSGFWDCTAEFADGMNRLFALNRQNKIQLVSPLLYKTKDQTIAFGVELGVRFDQTWTCYEGGAVSCLKCPACSGRVAGFIRAGFIDPLPYAIEIDWQKYGCVSIPC